MEISLLQWFLVAGGYQTICANLFLLIFISNSNYEKMRIQIFYQFLRNAESKSINFKSKKMCVLI